MTRAAIYERISKVQTGTLSAQLHDGDTSYSVEDQDTRCTALCESQGLEIVARYYDDGVSAYRSLKDRPGWQDLRTAVQNKSFDVLVFDRQDRLARDQNETLRFIADCRELGITWLSVDEGAVDLADTMQVLFAVYRGGEAESYSAKISTNSRKANQAKREKGLPGAGPRPFGFKADKMTHEPAEAAVIVKATEACLAGARRYELVNIFRESGLTTTRGAGWHIETVVGVLTRWRNCGWTTHHDEPYSEAVWQPIVTREQVEGCRALLLRAPTGVPRQIPKHLASGIVQCECGLPMYANGDDGKLIYSCVSPRSRHHVKGSKHANMAGHILNAEIMRALALVLTVEQPDQLDTEATKLGKLYTERAEIEQARELLNEQYFVPGQKKISAKQYDALSNDHEHALTRLQAEIDGLTASNVLAAMRVDVLSRFDWEVGVNGADLIERLAVMTERIAELSLDHQRTLLSSLLKVSVAIGGRGPTRVRITDRDGQALDHILG